MTIFNFSRNLQKGLASSAVITIIAVLAIGGGIAYYALSDTQSPKDNQTPQVDTSIQNQPANTTEIVQPKPKISVDAETFCQQISAVGGVFNKEYTGGRVRENASFGPKAGCSWNGPTVTVYFGDKSYHRMSTGFGSEINEDYAGLDFTAFKKETSTTTAGYEIRVESDKGWTIVINDGRGLKQDITKEQYNKIAHIVNDALNQHY
ncbi:hypothetical protein [Kangiella sediminilitoris]|uniref:Uncharacterized protein n=1 Tax=Kangiella sediminilitoris TaxID=1144748 RepID=A0A1B3B7M2_9GAMM|nr:hypothetical protein [Kangiella sediminilitoris]AOE48789.1 hypothetical protein KS2013_57 [Kangiella sediminilitoris]